VRAALRNTIQRQDEHIRDLGKNLDAMSAVFNSPIGEHVIAPEIMRVLAVAYRSDPTATAPVTVTLPAEALRFLRPNEAAELILDKVGRSYRTGTYSRAVRQISNSVTFLRVTLPEVICEFAVADLPAKKRA
jgi:hypothetical protein